MHLFRILMITVLSSQLTCAQYRVSPDTDQAPHPLDQKYLGKLDFSGTNSEMSENITHAENDWKALMNEKLDFLKTHLPKDLHDPLIQSQTAWEIALQQDRAFFYALIADDRFSIGREGALLSAIEFMNRIRKRALDLTEYACIITHSD